MHGVRSSKQFLPVGTAVALGSTFCPISRPSCGEIEACSIWPVLSTQARTNRDIFFFLHDKGAPVLYFVEWNLQFLCAWLGTHTNERFASSQFAPSPGGAGRHTALLWANTHHAYSCIETDKDGQSHADGADHLTEGAGLTLE